MGEDKKTVDLGGGPIDNPIAGQPIDRSYIPETPLSGASGGTDGVRTGDPIAPGRDPVAGAAEESEEAGSDDEDADDVEESLEDDSDEDADTETDEDTDDENS